MGKLMEFLDGKKTYLQAAAAAVVIGGFLAGLIDEKMATGLLGLLGAGTIASMRAAIDKGPRA